MVRDVQLAKNMLDVDLLMVQKGLMLLFGMQKSLAKIGEILYIVMYEIKVCYNVDIF